MPNARLTYIFVHGLSGWGSYDKAYARMPYWGMRGGDLMAHLRKLGHDCYAASVAPTGSAWDRACELYAQIAGTRVDYGKAHSERNHHERFGRDFSSCPLIAQWNDETRLVLLGHSFGGATVRLFAELLANGDPEERETTGDETLSPLFVGGMAQRIHSLVTLAAPTNGTTAYDLYADATFKMDEIAVPWWSKVLSSMMSLGTKPRLDGRAEQDYANFDMHIDEARRLNERIHQQPHIYYYSVPCNCTTQQLDGTWLPDRRKMEPLFIQRAIHIGCYAGRTAGGYPIDASWRKNDGLVNTISAEYPFNAPHQPLDKAYLVPGVWQVFPEYDGDHMALQGGLMRKHDIRGFYEDLLDMVDGTGEQECI